MYLSLHQIVYLLKILNKYNYIFMTHSGLAKPLSLYSV